MLKNKKIALGIVLLLCTSILLFAVKSLQGDVAKVIDGDTFVLRNGVHVRLIGINAPELHHPLWGEQLGGNEAKKHLEELLKGKKVRLELDVQTHDKYGRLLAYVYVGKTFVNAKMVEDGYGQVMTVPPNVRYQDLFLKLEREAREKGRGLWGKRYIVDKATGVFHLPTCPLLKKIKNEYKVEMNIEEINDRHYKPCSACKPLGLTPDLSKGVKYVGNKSTKKFHRLNCPWGRKISAHNNVYFKTREEAVKQGYIPCKVCNP